MSWRRTSFTAGRWTGVSAATRTGLQVIQVIILARLLAPADFGLMAIAASIMAAAGLFSDLGFSRAIIHFEDVSQKTLSTLYWLNVMVGVLLSGAVAIWAPVLAAAFSQPELTGVFLATSPFFALSAIGQQFCSLAEKNFKFFILATNEVIAGSCGFVAAIASAINDLGVYSLVIGLLATTAVNSILAWVRLSDGYRPSFHLDISEASRFLRYGRYLIGDSFVNSIVRQSDVYAAGLLVSPAALGLYVLPRELSLRLASIINPIITRVGFPVMARLQTDRVALKSVYSKTLNMTASVNFPLYMAVGLFADEIVALLYGPKWGGAALYLRILAAWGLIRSTGNPVGSLLHAVGRVRLAFLWDVGALLVLPLLYWIAVSHFGLRGLAEGMVLIQVGLVLPAWWVLVRPCCGMSASEYFAQLVTPFVLAIVATLTAWLGSKGLEIGVLRLVLGSAIGGATYFGLSFAFNRSWASAMIEILTFKT